MQTILTILATLTCIAVGIIALIGVVVIVANLCLGKYFKSVDEEK